MENQTIYVLTAYRWGNRLDHSYTVGVFSSLQKAKEEAESHADYRGGNYDVVVDEHQIDQPSDGLVKTEVYRARGRRQ